MRRTLFSLLALATIACAGQDRDGDGYLAEDDCDDDNDAVNPGAAEICDGIDNNCSGSVDEGVSTTWYADSDDDGYGNPEITLDACDTPEGFVDNADDCNDNSAEFKPGAAEFCDDPNDYNCDGSVGFEDADGDGVAACEDCADDDPAISPIATEVCDGIDNDCDGDIDVDTDPTDADTWYFDGDQDGYGDPAFSIGACDPPFGYTDNDDDCDDSSAEALPGGVEVCDGLDNDCDGTTDINATNSITIYTDGDGDGYGVSGTGIEACEILAGYADADGDCEDGDDLINPGEEEVCNDGVDNNCDGVTSGCEANAADAGLALSGDAAQDYFGYSMAGDVDLNGDGNVDLVVGATQAEISAVDGGGAYVWYGPVSSGAVAAGTADARLYAPNSAARAGLVVTNAGDMNADGSDDLIITAERANSNGIASGSAYLFLGGGTALTGDGGLADNADHEFTGQRAYYWLGAGARAAGDVNGDGSADLLLGSTGDDTAGANNGRIILLLGGPDPSAYVDDVSDGDASWTGVNSGDFMGQFMTGAGDMDGDGFDDIAVGDNRSTALGAHTGAAFLISGVEATDDVSLTDSTARVDGDAAGDRLGQSVSPAGDLNGDGLADLLVGANRVDTNGADAGAAFVIPGSSSLSSYDAEAISTLATHVFYGDLPSDGLGAAVAGGQDFDGDGTADVLLGVNFAGFNGEGASYLFLSPAAGTYTAGTDEDAVVVGDGSGDGVGRFVGFGGDLFGSSSASILVGSWQDDTNGADSGGAYVFDTLGL